MGLLINRNSNQILASGVANDKRPIKADGPSDANGSQPDANSLVENLLNFARQNGYRVSEQEGMIQIYNTSGEIVANITRSPDRKQLEITSYDSLLTGFLDNNTGKLIHQRKAACGGVEFKLFPKLSKREISLLMNLGYIENGFVSVAYNLSKKTPSERKQILGELFNLPATSQESLAVGSERMSEFVPVNPTVANHVIVAMEWALANGYAEDIGITGLDNVAGVAQGDLYHGHLCVRQGSPQVAPGDCTQDFLIIYHSRETENGQGENAYMRNFYQDSSEGTGPISTSAPGMLRGISSREMGLTEVAQIYVVVCPEGKYTLTMPDGNEIRVNIYFIPTSPEEPSN